MTKRRWTVWVLIPAILGAAIGAVMAARITPAYKSETVILVVPQRIPESYVRSSITATIRDRIQSISQQILSRTRLERIITDFDLYSAERQRGDNLEHLVEMMRTNVAITVGEGETFRVAFTGTDPRTVMKVTERLASLFIEENLRDRELLAEGTNQFLVATLDDVRTRLVQKNTELRSLKRAGTAAPEAEPLEIEYEVLQTTYKDLLAKVEASQVASNLERRQIGEQFKLIDPARRPEHPITPNWRQHIGTGAATGALIGLLALAIGTRPSGRESPHIEAASADGPSPGTPVSN